MKEYTPPRVLVACESSGTVRDAFAAIGWDAWSCDLLPSTGQHIQGDAREAVKLGWDLLIAHPPCTHLAVSGARHFAEKRADGRQQEGIAFFMAMINAPVERIAVENPVCIMSSVYRKADQTIQPWQHGHGHTKATCLWLKGLLKLRPSNLVEGREPYCHNLPPSPDRWRLRSKTYDGIARAMADQWGNPSKWPAPQLRLFA